MAVYHFFYQVNDEAEMAEGDMATLKALPHLKVGGREDSIVIMSDLSSKDG